MACTRSTCTSLLVLIAAISAAEAQWSYKTTQNGQYKLGRNGSNLSAEVRSMIVAFRVPPEWRVSACTDEPMDCIFSAGSSPNGLSLAFSLYQDIVSSRSRNGMLATWTGFIAQR